MPYYPENGSDKEPFFGFLRHTGFDVYTTCLVETADGSHEKESDLRLAVEMVAGAFEDAYDRAVLVTGDRDFLPAVETVQELSKPVTVVSFAVALADDLADQADDVVRIDDIAEEIRRCFYWVASTRWLRATCRIKLHLYTTYRIR